MAAPWFPKDVCKWPLQFPSSEEPLKFDVKTGKFEDKRHGGFLSAILGVPSPWVWSRILPLAKPVLIFFLSFL